MDFDELWNALLHSQYSKILQNGAFQDNSVKQRFLRRKKADKDHLPAKLSFGSKEEYIATLSVEARITQEYEEREQRQSFRCSATVEQMMCKGKNINVVSLTNVPSKNHDAIRPGDKAMVRYKQPAAEHFRRGQWELRIIESPPSSEPRTLLGLLESPRTSSPSKDPVRMMTPAKSSSRNSANTSLSLTLDSGFECRRKHPFQQ
ncbi:hypothetical protein SCUP515_05544 [Seiridium cupressi]